MSDGGRKMDTGHSFFHCANSPAYTTLLALHEELSSWLLPFPDPSRSKALLAGECQRATRRITPLSVKPPLVAPLCST